MNIPPRILEEFGESARGLEFGKTALELHFKQGIPRIVINTQKSFHLTKKEVEGLFLEGAQEGIESRRGRGSIPLAPINERTN